MVKVIDTSYHKGFINWTKVRDYGVEGVILKCLDGYFMPDDMTDWAKTRDVNFYESPTPIAETIRGIRTTWTQHVDPSFKLYWEEVGNTFDWRGAYLFLRVDDEKAETIGRPTSIEQVDLFYDTIVEYGLKDTDYIVVDLEVHNEEEIGYLTHQQVAERVYNALRRTETKFNRKPILYTAKWWFDIYRDGFTKEQLDYIKTLPNWLAHYWTITDDNDFYYSSPVYYIKPTRLFPRDWLDDLNKRIAYCNVPVLSDNTTQITPTDMSYMWQYSSSGKIPGIDGGTDISLEIFPEEEWEKPTDPTDPGNTEDNMTLKELLIKFILWLLKLLGIDLTTPEEPTDPPTPPAVEDSWPTYVKALLGNWDTWKDKESLYTPNDLLGIWQVSADQAALWTYSASSNVIRPDGTRAKKYIFDVHVLKEGTAFWNLANGVRVLGFKKLIPTNPKEVWSEAYADGETYIEILSPAGLTVKSKHVKRLGYFDADGNYTED